MGFKTRYSAVRNATWIWYLLALVCFVLACQSFPVRGGEGSMFSFIWWISISGGLVFSAGRAKRNAAAKLAAQHRVG